jgi:hypothetical protein
MARVIPSRKILAAAAVTIALVALSLPANAFHNPGPVAATTQLNGNGWISYRFDVAAPTDVDVEVEVVLNNAPAGGGGAWLMKSNGQLIGALALAPTYGGGTQVHVQLADPVGTVVSQQSGGINSLMGGAMGFRPLPAGQYIAVMLGASAGGPPTVRGTIYGNANVTVANKTTGNAFWYYDPDFRGLANVAVSQAPARAQAIVAGSVSQAIAGKLFGWFGNSLQPTMLSYDDASGHHMGGNFFMGAAPGNYKFNVDLTVGLAITGVWSFGGDVTLA